MQRPAPVSQNSLLDALPLADQDLIAPHLAPIELARGRLLYEPGDAIDFAYFPHDGVISLMTLMENPRQSLSRAIVQTPLRAARISVDRLHEVWARSPALRTLVDRHNEALYGHAIQSVACNALHSVEARFCRWLLTCHDRIASDRVTLTQEFLADMLGVQRTTVTAVARALQEKDVIRYRRGVVEVVDRRALLQTSCECYRVVRGHYERLLGAPPDAATPVRQDRRGVRA